MAASIDSNAGPQPTLSALVLRRAGFTMPTEVLVTPRRHLESIPTYSLIDVIRCAQPGPQALRAAFGGKIVIFGGTLPEEDRKQTSGRFLPVPPGDFPASACGLRHIGPSDPSSNTVAGVFLHAAAIEAVATGDLTTTAPRPIVAGVSAISAGLGAVAGLALAPWTTVVSIAVMVLVLFFSSVVALQLNYWIPIGIPFIALAISPGVAFSVRYLAEERARRRVQHAFNHYLDPAIVERLADDPAALNLGGERREVTVMFADLTGFSAASSRLEPEPLTALVNRYLGYVVEEVQNNNGYVDKFIGDAVMAMWGAPASDPDHAANAVRAAMAAARRVRGARLEDLARGAESFALKIGINSGPAVVGNVGTEKRCNYTVVGETVNLASRLERAPDIYHCPVIVGARTAELAGTEFLMRELDWLLVKGAKEPMVIFEPIAARAAASPDQIEQAEKFAEALARYRAKRFEEAATIWEDLARNEGGIDSAGNAPNGTARSNPPLVMARRARGLIAHPPPDEWNGAHALDHK